MIQGYISVIIMHAVSSTHVLQHDTAFSWLVLSRMQLYIPVSRGSVWFICPYLSGLLTHRGRVTHIGVSKLIIIGSDNGLSPGRCHVIIWTNAGILSIGTLGTNFSEILIEILTFSFKKMRLKNSSAKWRLFCVGLNELTGISSVSWFPRRQSNKWNGLAVKHKKTNSVLTHLPLVPHICVNELGHHWSR